MKLITILLLMSTTFSISAYGYFVNLDSCSHGHGSDMFSHKDNCEKTTGSQCVEFNGGSCSVQKLVSEELEDKSNPIYAFPSDSEPCSDKDSCIKILESKKCREFYQSFINEDYSQVYCTKIDGYEKITVHKLEIDEQKLQSAQELEALKIEETNQKIQERELVKQDLKSVDMSKVTNVTHVKELLVKLLKILNE